MHSIEYNLALLSEMMGEFDGFLLSEELFWPLQRKSFEKIPFPQLSLGALLLSLDELSALRSSMDSHQERKFQNLLTQYERFYRIRRVAMEKKSAREVITRTNLWRAYLQDVEEDPAALDEYANQVRNRLLMAKLETLSSSGASSGESNGFKAIDERILGNATPADFIWDERLKAIYPVEEYPYLYIKPR